MVSQLSDPAAESDQNLEHVSSNSGQAHNSLTTCSGACQDRVLPPCPPFHSLWQEQQTSCSCQMSPAGNLQDSSHCLHARSS